MRVGNISHVNKAKLEPYSSVLLCYTLCLAWWLLCFAYFFVFLLLVFISKYVYRMVLVAATFVIFATFLLIQREYNNN